jgi:membrane protein DedA with SNARE-associated domain
MVIIAGVILALSGSLEIYQVITVCFILIVSIESFLYLIGYKWGDRILTNKIVLRIFPKDRQEKLKSFSNSNPRKLITTIRVAPLLRPYFTIFMGAMKLKPKMFFPRHAVTVSVYLGIMISGTFYFGQAIQELPPFVMNLTIGLAFMVWFLFMRKLKNDFKSYIEL